MGIIMVEIFQGFLVFENCIAKIHSYNFIWP